MQFYEISIYIENLKYLDVNNWEQCRLIVYSISSLFSKNKITPKDVLKFPWEEELKEDIKQTSISNDDIARIREKVKNIKIEQYGNIKE